MLSKDEWKSRCEAELGKPYIWGGEGPDGYDCSGLTQWALSLLGLDPPADQTAEGLYRFFLKAGRAQAVSLADSGLGDLVFFGSDEGMSHVALAWGGEQMLEAGGGGRTTTTPERAKAQHAEVRIRPISRRRDLAAILRPSALVWADDAAAEALEAAVGHGAFDNPPPLSEWLDDGRRMRLKRPFGYLDPAGLDWPVPSETIVDGASIPQVFWSLIGGPFEGPYRNASIVHDHYCDEKSRPWQDTHRMFYEAMLCGGVGGVRAKVMYYAVYRFGPRWTLQPPPIVEGLEAIGEAAPVPAPLPSEGFDPETFAADAAMILETAPDLRSIEAMADTRRLESLEAGVDEGLREQLVDRQDGGEGGLLARYSAASRPPRAEDVEALEAAPSFETLRAGYEALFASCVIRPERAGEVAWHRQKLLQYRPRYEAVAAKTGVPWWFLGVVHALEASFNFQGHLHNGDPLSARTVQVPAGRPKIWNPPNDWESSAVDALTYQGYAGKNDWTLARALYRWEAYNGFGYHSRGINSPYLWSFSNHYSKGKFVKDGKFDPNAVSKQCGAAAMLKALQAKGDVQLPA